jgi:tRNA 2-thiouridine synthesizing protein A
MEAMKADHVLDCKGVLCPMPVIRVSQAIKTIGVGQILEVQATDPGSRPDMEAWSRQTGHELLASHEANGVFTFYIRRTK